MGIFEIQRGKPLPFGVSKQGKNIQFTISFPGKKEVCLHLFFRGQEKGKESILLDEKYKVGSIFSVIIREFPFENYEYIYEVDGKEFLDPYARLIYGREEWAKALEKDFVARFHSGIVFDDYSWEEDTLPMIPFSESILYQMHVRGFTRHYSSKVEAKGTFRGIIEKLSYLKELQINGIVLLPIYEFNEVITSKITDGAVPSYMNYSQKEPESKKINYWGYGNDNHYFAPKASYGRKGKCPVTELKDMVKELHRNQIEVIMEMYFQVGTNPVLIVDCLRYWAMEYHIDGFRINGDGVPMDVIAQDPILSNRKLLANYWAYSDKYSGYERLAECNEGFLVDTRRFLKSDEEQVDKFLGRMKRNPEGYGVINYITSMNGFTLMDLVSYDIKHNEDNGENGRDGTDYNYSWNCGVEGKTKRKNVLFLRRKQIRNAILMLLLSQGTPMILSGDEFGNSSKGNNNPYCQDNAISWLNWNQLDTNGDIFMFFKEVISIRKNHKIFHMPEAFRAMDYISVGCPDISFHGTKAWYPDFSNYSRVLGVMFCGKYAKVDRKNFDWDFYIAFNMHWEPHEFDLPNLLGNKEWRVLLDTSVTEQKNDSKVYEKKYLVKARTVIVFIGIEVKS